MNEKKTPIDGLLASLRPLTQKELEEIRDKTWFSRPLKEEAYEITGADLKTGDVFLVTFNRKLLKIGSSRLETKKRGLIKSFLYKLTNAFK